MKSFIVFALVITGTTISAIPTLTNIVFSQAVDLIDIHTTNETLNTKLPDFYSCIDDKISSSKGAEEDHYFEKEPTKHEVKLCYQEVFESESQMENGVNGNFEEGN